MFRIIGTAALKTLQAEVDAARAEADRLMEAAFAADAEVERLRTALAHAEGELAVLRTQTHLDSEDRVALRMLLRTVRRQTAERGQVAVLFRKGELQGAYSTPDDAQAAAVADGAPRDGWERTAPGTPMPSAADVAWRVTVLPIKTEQ